MHDSVALHKMIRTAIAKVSEQPTKLLACNEIRPTYRAYVALTEQGEDDGRGTRYLVLVNGTKCEAMEIDYYTREVDWDIRIGDVDE